jgi:hypothetical protein
MQGSMLPADQAMELSSGEASEAKLSRGGRERAS